MKQAFKAINFRQDTVAKIEQANAIIEEYQGQGLRLTLRQLYYQHVARGLIPNTDRSYKALGTIVSDGRLAGLVDWDAIEDRGRQPDVPSEWGSIESLVEGALRAYRLPRWRTQDRYVELWVEKQALAGVLEPLASEFHVTLMVNKGYSSSSAMYESAERFQRGQSRTKEMDGPLLLYLGDHDPSGEDMVRDVRDRLELFGVTDLTVTKLALTMEQIRQYDPPPNPAKVTDSRAAAYIAEHGDSSWEVDALPPNVLAQVIRDAFDEVVDTDAMDAIKAQEEADKKELRKAAKKISKKRDE